MNDGLNSLKGRNEMSANERLRKRFVRLHGKGTEVTLPLTQQQMKAAAISAALRERTANPKGTK